MRQIDNPTEPASAQNTRTARPIGLVKAARFKYDAIRRAWLIDQTDLSAWGAI